MFASQPRSKIKGLVITHAFLPTASRSIGSNMLASFWGRDDTNYLFEIYKYLPTIKSHSISTYTQGYYENMLHDLIIMAYIQQHYDSRRLQSNLLSSKFDT